MLMAIIEIAGVASIAPFMALVGDVSILDGNNIFSELYKQSEITNPYDFIFWLGLGVVSVLTVSSMISMYTIWHLSLFAQRTGVEIGDRLYKYYLNQPWLFHTAESSAKLTKQIAVESDRVTSGIINPLMQINARLMLAVFMLIAIFLLDPVIAVVGLIIFTLAYSLLYKLIRLRLLRNGEVVSNEHMQRFHLMSAGFGGIKDVLLLGRQQNFIQCFEVSGKILARSQSVNMALSQIPRYIMELIAFGSIIFLVLFLIKSYDGNLGTVLPILAVYALAGFKLLPAFQQIYSGVAQIKGNTSAFESIKRDLKASQSNKNNPDTKENVVDRLPVKQSISLDAIEFTYPGKNVPALTQLDLIIPINKVVGVVGLSGSGKSTAIDIILGLIKPDSGQLLIDGKPLETEKIRAWQNTLGFVSQNIFLSDNSILENIAFGLSIKDINVDRVKRVVKLTHLDELIEELPDGLDSPVGERGVKLSGGQRQRIGIARSLYHNASVLVFDEATSALDGITEKLIIDSIDDFAGTKTIIMIAHRLTTLIKCDIIYFMDRGKVIDEGSYDELIERNLMFKKMAMKT